MTWAKLDDRFHGNRKVKRAWRQHPASIGLYAMVLTYCAQHETDGRVDLDFIRELVPHPRQRQKAIATLLEVGLWHVLNDEAYLVHDYCKFNPSRAQLESKREKDRIRKAKSAGFRAESACPVPTRPDPDTSNVGVGQVVPLRSADDETGHTPTFREGESA